MPEPIIGNAILITIMSTGCIGGLYLVYVGISEWLGQDIADLYRRVYDHLELHDIERRRSYGGMFLLAVGSWFAGHFDGHPKPSLVVILIALIMACVGWFLLTSDKCRVAIKGKDGKGQ